MTFDRRRRDDRLTDAFVHPPRETQAFLIDASSPSTRARTLGVNQAATLLGAAIGPVLGGVTVGAFDLGCRSPFVFVGGLCGVAAAHAWWSVPETLPSARASDEVVSDVASVGRTVGAATAAGASTSDHVDATSESLSDTLSDEDEREREREREDDAAAVKTLLSSKDFLAVSGLNAALFFSGAGGRATLLPLVAATEHGYTPHGVGLMFAAMAATQLAGVAPAAYLADKTPSRAAVILPGVLASSAAVAAVATTKDANVFAAACVAWAASHALMGPAPAAFAADVAPKRARGTAIGAFRSCGDVGLMIGPVALGAIADASDAGVALAVNAVGLAAAGVAFKATARDCSAAKK